MKEKERERAIMKETNRALGCKLSKSVVKSSIISVFRFGMLFLRKLMKWLNGLFYLLFL